MQDNLTIPPHSVEAEQSVIGGLILDNSSWDRIAGRLTEQDFYRHSHRLIFGAIEAAAETDAPFDIVTLSSTLESEGTLQDVGGLAYLGEIGKNTPSTANIKAYASLVRDHAISRELIAAGASIQESACGGGDIREKLDKAQAAIMAITEERSKSGASSIRDVTVECVDDLERRHEQGDELIGISTGYPDIDRLTLGLTDGDLIILAARPSAGKTTLAMNIIESAVMGSQKTALFFSLEMAKLQIGNKVLASVGRIPLKQIRNGQLDDDHWPRITSAIQAMSTANMWIDDSPALTVSEIRARARLQKRRTGCDLIVVDYLQLARGDRRESRNLEVGEISQGLKALAKELRVPVVALSQLSRDIERRTGSSKRPRLSDLRDSGSLEQDADQIWFIHSDEPDREADQESMELIVAKNRNGATGSAWLEFMKTVSRFEQGVRPSGEQRYSASRYDLD